VRVERSEAHLNFRRKVKLRNREGLREVEVDFQGCRGGIMEAASDTDFDA